ncbi:hypothetical protein [uncultured Friedmanniella sp.]|uniref:hypothetical protein n=1 Tax=uncultured Friedmanniella sp. TaxID=335381 RepID=UPI0035CC0ECC
MTEAPRARPRRRFRPGRGRAAALPLLLALPLVLGPLGSWLGPTAAEAKAAQPQLSVAMDNGQSSATPGGRSRYTVTVTNLGTAKLKTLRLSQTVPEGARLVSAGSSGKVGRGQVSWTLDVPATGHRTVSTTLEVGSHPAPDLLRLASVACVRATPSGPPLVCATDSDELPAGAAAASAASAASAAPAASSSASVGVTGWSIAAGVAALLAAAVAVLVVRRRRRSAPVRSIAAQPQPEQEPARAGPPQ